MKKRLRDQLFGFGPLYDEPPSGDGAPAGQNPAPGAPPTSGAPAAGGSGAPAPGTPPDGFVPYERFKPVNDELQTLRAEKAERERKDLEAKGQHEQLAAREKERADAERTRADRIGRRAAFVAAASGKVADVNAAAKLAAADGLLDKLEVDDEGAPKDAGEVDKIVAEIVKRYEFLKPGTRTENFGDPRNGTGPSGGAPDPKDARGMLAAGYATTGNRRQG